MIKAETIQKVIEELKTGINYEYFFKEIDSPDWIDPLLKEGFFKDPPKPLKTKVPFWPESRYLVRVADKAPEEVLSIIINLTKTDNINVHQDCCEAAYKACSKTPELATKFAFKEAQWINNQRQIHWLYLEACEKLIFELIKSGIKDAAYELIKVLLSIQYETKEVKTPDDEIWKNVIYSPKIIFESWRYGKFLNKILPISTDFIRENFLLLLILSCRACLNISPEIFNDSGREFIRVLIPCAARLNLNELLD